MKRPKESDEECEEEEGGLAKEPNDGQTTDNLSEVPTEGQIDVRGLVEDNACTSEKDPQASFEAMVDQGKDDVPPPPPTEVLIHLFLFPFYCNWAKKPHFCTLSVSMKLLFY